MILKTILKVARNFVSLLTLAFVFPILVFVGLFIFAEDGFPIFFKQDRIGKGAKKFTIIKMRTLKKNAPNIGTHNLQKSHMLANSNWIRTLKLDEFPQLVNVLKGEINIVGPRPGLVIQSELFDERSSKNIYSIKPGITGLAQILGYDMSNPRKLAEIDEIYIINRSLIINFLIILGTFFNLPKKILRKKFKI
jgi:O-antigen biosynthesis protein WbqP